MLKNLKYLLLFYLISLNFSCSEYKNIPYYQDLNVPNYYEENINNYSQLKIQPGDILAINVSSVNPEAASVFNTSINRVNGSTENTPNNPVYGFKVNADGDLQLPLVGDMKVIGLTIDDISKQLTANLLPYLKSPIVNVRIVNFKISVLGDVLRPDVYTITNDHINVNEALGLAGDLNITAKRKNVLLVREINGKREYFVIDLTKKELFNSPYYYLKNNDILYIQPDKTKYGTVERSSKSIGLILTGLSVIAIVVSAILVQHHL